MAECGLSGNFMDTSRASGARRGALDPSMLIGVPEIDDQHGALVAQLERIVGLGGELAPPDILTDVLGLLGRTLSDHFDTEERYFERWDMPSHAIAAHRYAHSAILDQYAELNLDLMHRKAIDPAEVARMLTAWIIGHVRDYDLPLRLYVCEPA